MYNTARYTKEFINQSVFKKHIHKTEFIKCVTCFHTARAACTDGIKELGQYNHGRQRAISGPVLKKQKPPLSYGCFPHGQESLGKVELSARRSAKEFSPFSQNLLEIKIGSPHPALFYGDRVYRSRVDIQVTGNRRSSLCLQVS